MRNLRSVIVPGQSEAFMGFCAPKLFREICGMTLLERSILQSEGCGAERCVLLSSNEAYSKCIETLEDATQLEDVGFFDGFSGDVMVIRGDMPYLTCETLTCFYEEYKASGAIAACFSGAGNVIFAESALFCEKIRDGIDVEDVYLEAKSNGEPVLKRELKGEAELSCVTNAVSYATLSKMVNERNVNRIMESGVFVTDPSNTYIGDFVKIGCGTVVEPGCFIFGKTEIGEGCVIGPQTRLCDMSVKSGAAIVNSVCVESVVESGAMIGPFSYIRPNSRIGENVKIGDFVEVKNSVIGKGTKVSHLTYVGDSDVGGNVNFGCGTVTVNYDGRAKHRTKIGDNAFIGCNTNLVAPVEVAENAFTAAGSTITDYVPADSLAIARARQVNKDGWVTGRKEKNK